MCSKRTTGYGQTSSRPDGCDPRYYRDAPPDWSEQTSDTLTVQDLPSWAIFGTAGASITAYTHVLQLMVPVLTVGLAVGAGYYVGRQYMVAESVRPFVWTVALGSVLGVSLASLPMLWGDLTTIGASGFGIPATRAQEMPIMDIALPAVVLLRYLAEVALVITVGVFAGAALAQFQETGDSSTAATHTDTDTLSVSAQTPGDDSAESDLQPAQ